VSADVVDGNPVFTDHHQVTIQKYVNFKYSKQDPCDSRSDYTGPTCAVSTDYAAVTAKAWDGVPNDSVQVVLCNNKVTTPAVGGGAQDGLGDRPHGCDWANWVSSRLDGNGECCVGGNGFYLQMPSSATLSQAFGSGPGELDCRTPNGVYGVTSCNTQPEAVCPPTPTQISAGWTCVVQVSETPTTIGQPTHAGYRNVYLKSPIPSIACGGTMCPQFIPTGTQVTVTGVQFPCRVRRLDDTVATPNLYDGACIGKWTNKLILIKRVSTQTVVASVTPTSQTSGFDGSYAITFTMPSVPAASEQYKVIAHSPDCSLPCDSGKFNAAGKLFVHQ